MTGDRLTVGSGPHYADGWVNLDLYDPPAGCRPPDVYGSVFDLVEIFGPSRTFDQVYLGHVLEHLEWDRIPEALDQVRQVCRPGASVMVVGPAVERAVQTGVALQFVAPGTTLLDAILADPRQEPTGHGHAWTPTAALTLEAVQSIFPEARQVPIEYVTPPLWPNPTTVSWQVAVEATLP